MESAVAGDRTDNGGRVFQESVGSEMGGSDGGYLNGHLSCACLVYERGEFRVAEDRAFAVTGAYGICVVCGAVCGVISCSEVVAEEGFLIGF